MANPSPSLLDPGQITKRGFDDVEDVHRVSEANLSNAYESSTQSVRVRQVAGSLVTEPYDNIALTYVAAGNGAGEIETVTFKEGVTTVAVLTLAYDASNRLLTVTRS